ncbi:cytochrome-c oxidase, cbb3-type subunit III [Catenovulum maritimum]|jgi:cytochrome c oxidase cbb3-type subunit 3|uniref:Cbb3-type cytochrome c oxidase subunit n=1 Tax=Catenovulum maritimum TaxID=1513271 RepID=A0A0J8GYV2_9ALTE|nr:cytochrome-c oxidase, cbb3-type subunit III [Catenovulum maritimum]KMT66419.1 cytochrome Cbb3 [Catenovulum maritimum]
MSTFWSLWVAILSISCLVLVFGILYWNMQNYTGVEEGKSMGHEFDGIEELNNPLPAWWTKMFWATAVWAVYYLIAYPGLGNYAGILDWTSSNQGLKSVAESKAATQAGIDNGLHVQYDQEVVKANEKFGPIFEKFAKQDIVALAKNEDALEIGQRLFLQNCSQCHGSDARGGEGFPNLTDNDWLYGGSPEKIKESLLIGRKAAMPGWEATLGEDGVKQVTAYVISLSGREVDSALAAAGEAKYGMCAACHGADGKGSLAHNLPFGAPDLTDNIWLYGGSERAITETIKHGRNGVMPAWKEILGEDKVHIISAYVYSLSNK